MLTNVEGLLLSYIRREGPATGYDLTRTLARSAFRGANAGESSIYPVLKRLGMKGLLTSNVLEAGNRPKKILWSLTACGAAAHEEWAATPVTPDDFRNSHAIFEAKLALAESMALEQRREFLQGQLAVIKEYRARAVAEMAEHPWVENRFISQIANTALQQMDLDIELILSLMEFQ